MLETMGEERASTDPLPARAVGLQAAALVGVAPEVLDAIRAADVFSERLSALDWALMAMDADRVRRAREQGSAFGRGAWVRIARAVAEDEEALG